MDVGSRERMGLQGWGLEGQGTRAVRLLGAADLRAPWEVLTRPTPTLAAAVCGARGTLWEPGRLSKVLCGPQLSLACRLV